MTVNLPEYYLEAIEKLTISKDENGELDEESYNLYPSRSELVRVAIRNFLIRELRSMKEAHVLMDSHTRYRNRIESESESNGSIVIDGEQYFINDKRMKKIKEKGIEEGH